MALTATASQAPNDTARRKALVREEVSHLVGETRKLSFVVERNIVALAQGKCPVTDRSIKSCEQCQDKTLGNTPFTLNERQSAHLSELQAMISAVSYALCETIKKSPLFSSTENR